MRGKPLNSSYLPWHASLQASIQNLSTVPGSQAPWKKKIIKPADSLLEKDNYTYATQGAGHTRTHPAGTHFYRLSQLI